jgi:hypothetical protein
MWSGSTPVSPEEKAAAKAEKIASRSSIADAKKQLNDRLSTLKDNSAKEDYEPAKELLRTGLDWLKAHPNASPDDIGDYMTILTEKPLLQNLKTRQVMYMIAAGVEDFVKKRLKQLEDKEQSKNVIPPATPTIKVPNVKELSGVDIKGASRNLLTSTQTLTAPSTKILPTAKKIAQPILDYKQAVVTWLEAGRMTLMDTDYKDKLTQIQTDLKGTDENSDPFQLKIFMDDKALQDLVLKDIADANTFDGWRMTKTIFKYIGISLGILALVFCMFLGASYAANLNYYRSFAFRLFYVIYGALFFLIVLPYEWIYRNWWLGEPLQKLGYIPLFEFDINYILNTMIGSYFLVFFHTFKDSDDFNRYLSADYDYFRTTK